MDAEAAPLFDRILHARAEVLLRAAVRDDFGRATGGEQAPLVVVGFDRTGTTRWIAGGDAGLLAAISGELDPVAAGCLLVAGTTPGTVVGTAITVSAAGARALPLDARRRRLGRPRVHFGPTEDPLGVGAEVALALHGAVERAARLRSLG